jgi:threonine dehydrogenase-like Zn-dependent dehydrogenase
LGWPYQGDPKGEFFTSHVQLHGGLAPVRRILPDLIWSQKINPGKVFNLTLPLEQVAEGYRAMDEWRAIKALLYPWGENT